MDTGTFLRRHAYLYLYAAAFFLAGAGLVRGVVEQVSTVQHFSVTPLYVIDAGHGGIDSGASSANGDRESEINLQIARRLEKLLHLMGYETEMTRRSDDSVATEGDTIRAQKQSDLRNRVAMVNRQPNAILVSIHQNFYPDSRYSGPHVFYAGNGIDQTLAQTMQSALNRTLAPGSSRECKRSEGVYLMQQIECPGVLVECGFLSNPLEAEKLLTREYQNRLCCVIAAALVGNTA